MAGPLFPKRVFRILALPPLALLAACATPRHGDFSGAPVADGRLMAADTVKRLAALYPPAATRFTLKQPAADPYGEALVRALRAKGYAVAELQEKKPAGSKPLPPASPGLDLAYVVDRPGTDLYRVLVTVGPTSLGRAYAVRGGTLAPAGAWARTEASHGR